MSATLAMQGAEADAPQTPQKIPKAVQRARDLLGVGKRQLTIADLMNIDKKQQHIIATTMRNTMGEAARQMYKSIGNDDTQKKQLMFGFILDPHEVQSKGFNKTTAEDSQHLHEVWTWMSLAELGGPFGVGNPEHAQILAASGELDDRPSQYACLAERGAKEYHFCKTACKRKTGWKRENGVESAADLKPEEAAEVAASIVDSLGSTGAKRQRRILPQQAKPEQTEAEKELKASKLARMTSLRKLKALVDKSLTDVSSLDKDAQKLTDKGYPESLAEFYMTMIADLKNAAESAHKEYAAEVVKSDQGMDKASVDASGKVGEVAHKSLDAKIADFKKGKGADLKKLVA